MADDGRKFYRMANGKWRRIEGAKIMEYRAGDLVRLNEAELSKLRLLVGPTPIDERVANAEIADRLRPKQKPVEPVEPVVAVHASGTSQRYKVKRGEKG
jgi:hypothetical protein